MKIGNPSRANLTLISIAIMAAWGNSSAWAQESADVSPFELGAITVTATRPQAGEISEDQVASVITAKDMRQFNRSNVADALDLLSGTAISQGVKNERKITMRGFDSRQVGLFIDGIPVYVPYDGSVDLNRFTTADLAAIQVAKGFSSVTYGPNTLGGAINLVSRKPVAKFEGDAMAGFGEGNERQAQVNFGSNQGLWYVQGGASYLENDGARMSSDFVPTTSEDGGRRNNDYRKDQKVSLKFGLTPNASDEYAISYYKQEGEKGQPPSTIPSAARYWQWPYWNKESLYLITNTALGASEKLKFRLYHDSFDNAIDMYTNATYTARSSGGTGPSIYNDKTDGGSVELESTRIKNNTLRLVVHYKYDKHYKYDTSAATPAIEDMRDALISYALEDNIQLRPDLLLSLGAASHELKPDTLYNSKNTTLTLPGAKKATDAQAGLFYVLTPAARLYTTVARKSRLPTLGDRYSQSMSTYIENPNLQAEEAVNYEVGYQGTPWKDTKVDAAIFYSDISNMIQTWYSNGASCTTTNKCQRQNVGKVHASGVELGLRKQVSSQIELGGNYTYIDRNNISDPATKLTDVPEQKLTVHALYRPSNNVDLLAFAEHNSSRWTSNTVELAGYTTLNLKVAYRPMKAATLEAGINNVTDKNYTLAEGFPQPGRMWFANASYKF